MSADEGGAAVAEPAPVSKKNKYRREKARRARAAPRRAALTPAQPWDTDDIDHWKIQPFTEADVGGRTLVEETSFSTLFPKYREQYLRQHWPEVQAALRSCVALRGRAGAPGPPSRAQAPHRGRARPGRGQYDGAHHQEDVGSVSGLGAPRRAAPHEA